MKSRPARAKLIAVLLETLMCDSPFTQPLLKVVEEWLQVTDEQRRLAGRGYDGLFVHVES
jgi:hypothetical protein